MAKKDIMLDLLADMAEHWAHTTAATIDVVVAAVLMELGITSIDILLTNIEQVAEHHYILRTYDERNGVPFMTISIEERNDGPDTFEQTRA